jgi:hypothetical protein
MLREESSQMILRYEGVLDLPISLGVIGKDV